jgi:hypothetical protein
MSTPTVTPKAEASPSKPEAKPQAEPTTRAVHPPDRFMEARAAKKKAKRRRHRIAIRRSHSSG